jgi:hypothetical protein
MPQSWSGNAQRLQVPLERIAIVSVVSDRTIIHPNCAIMEGMRFLTLLEPPTFSVPQVF